MICSTCTYHKHCNIANDLFIIAGIHGIAIDITHCPIAKVQPGSEWVCDETGNEWICPKCGNSERLGHRYDCPLRARLKQEWASDATAMYTRGMKDGKPVWVCKECGAISGGPHDEFCPSWQSRPAKGQA